MRPTRMLAPIVALTVLAAALTGCRGGGSEAEPPDPAASASPDAMPVGSSPHRLEIDGETRSFIVHVPKSLPEDAPLVLMLHGGFGSAEQAEKVYGWNAQSEKGGFVVAYPDGLGRAWNAGDGCCGAPGNDGTDDVAFLEAVVASVRASLAVDADRIFATGMSNGAMMTYRLACDTELFAAIAPVAGTVLGDCDEPAPASVLAIHGLADTSVPFDGSAGDGAVEIDGAPVADVISDWREVDDCTDPVVTEASPVATSTASCADGRAVELITIADAGHQWPGARSSELRDQLGGDPPSTAIDATPLIWEFFAAHPRA